MTRWRALSVLMEVMSKRIWRLGLLLKDELLRMIFSSNSINSACKPAVLNDLTATETCSGSFDSGNA